tara:strand:- start:2080 stop:2997 length:918 start_codon:yes stop_codon:yes gene_type:complete
LNIRIATRKSDLAMWQANHVCEKLKNLEEISSVELIPMNTEGDLNLDQNLQKIGGKGLFIKELEHAILQKKADIAVHSMKDMPVKLPDGFCIAATLKRESPFDSLITYNNLKLKQLKSGAIIGTSSLRRKSQILRLRSDIEIKNLRGNVNTRMNKLEEGEFDAIILARAGIERLGLSDRITETFSPDDMIPAAAQGVIGIECAKNNEDIIKILSALDDKESTITSNAERSVNRELKADCQSPIGSYATITQKKCKIETIVASPDGSKTIRESIIGDQDKAVELGKILAQKLISLGAEDIIQLSQL